MQTYIIVVLLLSSGGVSAGLENVSKLAEFIADIYQQLPRSCIFIINSEAQQQDFEATVLMQTVRRYLLYEYIPIIKKTFTSGTRETCVAQRSIYVILSGNEETRRYINQTFLGTDSSRAIWLLFLDTNTSLEQFFSDINIPFDCQFLVAQPQGDHVVVLTEVYRVSPTLPLQTYRFGNWTAGGGLTWPSQGLYRRRNNLQGHKIQGTARHHIAAKLKNSSGVNDYSEIGAIFEELMNITTVIHEANSYGSKFGNGSWTGMMALVISGVADIGLEVMAVTKERSESVAFTDTLLFSQGNVFIRLHNNSDMAWDRYVTPFSYGLWLAVAIAVCALSICLALTNCGHDRNQGLTVPAVFFYIHACFCQQGQSDEVKFISSRIVILTSYMTSLVLLAAYSAFLISRLAVQQRDLPFRDLKGLLYDGSYKLGLMEQSSYTNIFDRATGGIEREVYKKMIAPFKNDMPVTQLDGFRRVCDDHKYAFIGTNFVSKFFSRNISCQLVRLPEISYPETMAFIISKNNPYRGLINWRLAQLRETGIHARILHLPSQENNAKPSTVDVSMMTVAPILAVLAAGYVIGVFILLIERCVHGDVFKYWSRESVRRHPYNVY